MLQRFLNQYGRLVLTLNSSLLRQLVKNSPKVVLVGPMGAGKTTIGKLLAKELGYSFIDSDKEIEARSGADIPWIFDVEGEDGFRLRESQVIEDLATVSNAVVATGGGAVVREVNRPNLKKGGCVVYLRTSVDQQYERTYRDKNRPLLQQENPRDILQSLFNVRDPIYREVADLVVDTDKKKPKAVVRQIVDYLSSLM